MQTKMKFKDSNELELEITINAKIGDIRAFVKKMNDFHSAAGSWPIYTLMAQFEDALKQADKTFMSQKVEQI